MLGVSGFFRDNTTALLLAGAAVGWYVASHAAADALAGSKLALRRRIVGHWLPIVIAAMLALVAGQSEVAVGILFATSVAALSLVLGIVTVTHEFASPPTNPGGFPVVESGAPSGTMQIGGTAPEPAPSAPWRRIWAFVLPAALLALLAGFRGSLNLVHAGIFLIEGLAIVALRSSRADFSDDAPAPLPESQSPPARSTGARILRAIQFILAAGVATVAAWAGGRAAHAFSREVGLISGGFVTATLLAPALVLPMIGSGMILARANLYSAAITSSVGIVLLNLCLGLPMLIAVWTVKPYWSDRADDLSAMIAPEPTTTMATAIASPTTAPATTAPGLADASPAAEHQPLRFPLPVWRVDTVLLIVLGLLLLPLAAGRWMPGKLEGVLMIIAYVVYMFLSTVAARA